MYKFVLPILANKQIFDTVMPLYSIDMVNDLRSSELPSQVILYDTTMH